ncbi:hypothetical protein OJ16_08420 [Vibrio renipiscarius]|uniref:Uncharacterized protein n=1 Tax=Vibrio renipiscarius TaxID=1461322 RepID=A0A0C2NYJ5_9VIBR|nr:hypothetical protein OJ16_08420 [Vibrio renipiscarius]
MIGHVAFHDDIIISREWISMITLIALLFYQLYLFKRDDHIDRTDRFMVSEPFLCAEGSAIESGCKVSVINF